MIISIPFFILSFLLLAWASGHLVRSLHQLSRFFGLSEYIVAFVLMSVATSIPELFVGLSSAFQNSGGLSFGNILGANIIKTTLIVGLMAVVSGGVEIESKIKRGNFWAVFAIALLPIFLALDGIISRGDGLVLILVFIFYIIHLFEDRRYFSKHFHLLPFSAEFYSKAFKNLGRFAGGVAIMFLGAGMVVWSGRNIAIEMSWGFIYFGAIFLALGTTLPEIFFSLKAMQMKSPELSIGNLLGGIAFDSALIIGLVALIRPIGVDTSALQFIVTAAILSIGFFALNTFVYTNSRISRNEGTILMLIYFLFLSLSLFF